MKKNKFVNTILILINILSIVLLGFILISNIMYNGILFKKFNYLIMFFGIIIYFLLIYLLSKLFNKINIKSKNLFKIIMLLSIILQIFVIFLLKVNPSWDFGIVLNIIKDSLNNIKPISSQPYLYQFQNNVLYAYIMKFLLLPTKLFKIDDILIPSMIINALFIDIGLIFIYKNLKLLFEEKKINFFILLLFLNMPIIFYIPIVYTDTIAFCILSILLYLTTYLLINNKKEENKKWLNKKLLISIFIGILFGIATQIKFTIIILLIAYIIIIIFSKDTKNNLKYILFTIIFFITSTFLIQTTISHKFDKEKINETSVPITHWIMMGLDNYGNYNYLDYQNTFKAGNKEDKTKYNIKVIKERMNNHIKNKSLLKFYSGKSAYLWNDGSYYLPELLRLQQKENFLQEFILTKGKFFNTYIYLLQIQHYIMIICLFLLPLLLIYNIIKKTNNKTEKIKYYYEISIIGYILFFTIWEVSSRYLFHILPLLIITSYLFMNEIITKINKKI